MKVKGFAKVVALAAAAALFALGATACGGKVAATVDGVNIMEDDITAEIQKYRESYKMTDKDAWGQYLAYYGYEPSSIRSSIIDSHVNQELIKKAAKENEVSVDKVEVDDYVGNVKSIYQTDAEWKNALTNAGLTEEKYRQQIEQSLLEQKLMEKVVTDSTADDAEVLNYANMYAQYSYNGAKKSSHILFSTNDGKVAQDVLNQIKAGTLSFEDAAAQYSIDGSASDGGNVGWDCLTTFVTPYQEALSQLEPGQMSELVNSEYGIHIIKCTEKFTSPEEVTSLDQLPAEFVESLRNMVKSYSQQNDFQTWLDTYRESANVVVNEMPKGLPYDIDMTAYKTEATTGDGQTLTVSPEGSNTNTGSSN